MGPFEEEEEGTGIASDVVKVEGDDLATPGFPQYRVNKTKQHTHTSSLVPRNGEGSSSMVVVPTPTGPMEFRKSTRDLKELSAGKEHTNEVSRSWRQKAWRWSQSVTSKLVANCFFFLNLRVFIKR